MSRPCPTGRPETEAGRDATARSHEVRSTNAWQAWTDWYVDQQHHPHQCPHNGKWGDMQIGMIWPCTDPLNLRLSSVHIRQGGCARPAERARTDGRHVAAPSCQFAESPAAAGEPRGDLGLTRDDRDALPHAYTCRTLELLEGSVEQKAGRIRGRAVTAPGKRSCGSLCRSSLDARWEAAIAWRSGFGVMREPLASGQAGGEPCSGWLQGYGQP